MQAKTTLGCLGKLYGRYTPPGGLEGGIRAMAKSVEFVRIFEIARYSLLETDRHGRQTGRVTLYSKRYYYNYVLSITQFPIRKPCRSKTRTGRPFINTP